MHCKHMFCYICESLFGVCLEHSNNNNLAKFRDYIGCLCVWQYNTTEQIVMQKVNIIVIKDAYWLETFYNVLSNYLRH